MLSYVRLRLWQYFFVAIHRVLCYFFSSSSLAHRLISLFCTLQLTKIYIFLCSHINRIIFFSTCQLSFSNPCVYFINVDFPYTLQMYKCEHYQAILHLYNLSITSHESIFRSFIRSCEFFFRSGLFYMYNFPELMEKFSLTVIKSLWLTRYSEHENKEFSKDEAQKMAKEREYKKRTLTKSLQLLLLFCYSARYWSIFNLM